MKPITINELAPLLETAKFTGGFFATKFARISISGAALLTLFGLGLGVDAWGVGVVISMAIAFIFLIAIPATIRKRYARELIAQELPERIRYLYKKHKAGNKMSRWIDQWYQASDSGKDITPSQMLVILQYTFMSAYTGLLKKRSRLKDKHLARASSLNDFPNGGQQAS